MTLGRNSVPGAAAVSCYKRVRSAVSMSMGMGVKDTSYDEGDVPSYWSYWPLQHFVQHAADGWAVEDNK